MPLYDDVIMRTIIEIPDEVVKSLDLCRRQEQKSRAALIREAIQHYLERKGSTSPEEAFGIWKRKAKDGVQYQDEIRSEWE